MSKITLVVDQKDVDSVFSWIKEKGSNLNNLWDRLIPIIKEKASYEFTDANPNGWKKLSKNYLKWKRAHGYPDTIGVRKGKLKEAATVGALIKRSKTDLEYGVDEDKVVENGVKYAFRFNKRREIFKYTHKYLNNAIDAAANKWLEDFK